MRLSIILSFRNEEAVLPELLRRLRAALDPVGVGYEMLFVNDASTDRSLELLRDSARKDSRIRVLTTARPFGHDRCARAGLERARGEAVVFMDSDLQDPPELIPSLIERWNTGADVVSTVRRRRIGESFLKTLITRIGYQALHWAFPLVTVEAGHFKLLSRRAADAVLKLRDATPFVRGMASWVGFNRAWVEYERQPRFAGRGHFPLLGGAPAAQFLSALVSFSKRPLYLALAAGIVLTVLSWLAGAAALVFIALGWDGPGWLAPVLIPAAIGGPQLALSALVGLYSAATLEEARGWPLVIIAEELGFGDAPSEG